LIAEMSEPKLGAIATSPFEVFCVVSCACEREGVMIAAAAAVTTAARRVLFRIGDS
jgi:hypothetical protein